MKLTNQQIYDYITLKLDKYQSPYFEPSWISSIFNESYFEWIHDAYKGFEVNEKRRADLLPLTIEKSITPAKTVSLSLLDPKSLYVVGLFADYSFQCRGVTKVYSRPVKPERIDNLGVDDPNRKSDEYFPLYITKTMGQEQQIEILTGQTPSAIKLYYIKTPTLIDIEGSPNGFIEIEQPQQYEVIDFCLQKLSQIIEGQFQYETQRVEISRNE